MLGWHVDYEALEIRLAFERLPQHASQIGQVIFHPVPRIDLRAEVNQLPSTHLSLGKFDKSSLTPAQVS